MVEQGGEIAQSINDGTVSLWKHAIRVEEDRDESGAFSSEDVGVVVVANIKGTLWRNACATQGVLKDSGVRFVGVDFSGSKDQVKIVSDAQGFQFFMAGSGTVRNQAEDVTFFMQCREGGMGVGSEGVSGFVLFYHEGVDLVGQVLRVLLGASIGEQITACIILPKFRGEAPELAQVLFSNLVDIRPVGVCPAEGSGSVVRRIGRSELHCEVKEGFMGRRVVMTDSAVQVEEEGADQPGDDRRGGRDAIL